MNIFAFKPSDYPPAVVRVEEGREQKKHIVETKTAEILDHIDEDALRRTALHKSALKDDAKWLRILSQKKDDKELIKMDVYGFTPLHYAAQRGVLNEMIAGRNKLLSLFEVTNEEGNTPLHVMAQSNNFDKSIIRKISSNDLEILFRIENIQKETILDICWHKHGEKLLRDLLALIPLDSAIREKFAFAKKWQTKVRIWDPSL